MTEYTRLLSSLKQQEDKIKDLPELISKIIFTKNQLILLRNIVKFLEENEDVTKFEWIDNSKQKKHATQKNKLILAQFNYECSSKRCLTVYQGT